MRMETGRGLARRDGAFRQKLQLGAGFDVEAMNARLQREIHFPRRLADAGEDDFRRRNARRQRAAQFAF